MRLGYFVLLAAATFLASVDAATVETPDFPTVARSTVTGTENKFAQRFLRANKENDDVDGHEERRLHAIETVASVVKSQISNSQRLENLFTQLNLHNQKGYLFGVSEMTQWAKAANRLQQGDYEVIMLKTMLKHYDQVDLARYIQSAKVSPNIGGLATDLQSALFAEWRLAGKSKVDINTMLRQKRPAVYEHWEAQRDNGLVKSYAKYLRENPLT